ncbi:MAG: hypothetical protein PHY80_05540 [Rickettsiales bacterium]|nr:hypothetical protein [Rickettsiales bacterium]
MMTEKLKELNNQLNEKIEKKKDDISVKDEIELIERKILKEELTQLEVKAIKYYANNNLKNRIDLMNLYELLKYIRGTHKKNKSNKTMIERVENLLENVAKKN